MRNILITGGAGFIGSNFIYWFMEAHPDYTVVNLDKLTYAGRAENLAGLDARSNYHFVQGDIADRALVKSLLQKYQINGIINFAAESHVDNSISGPEAFFQTNVMGTFALAEEARQLWMAAPGEYKPEWLGARFLHVSTDEVYGTLGAEGLFTEETPYAPNSPYSASKAGSDLLIRSYFHTYDMEVVTTNCSNNYGPRQHEEKLIPTIIRKALAGEEIPIYGDGKNVRDWLYVTDHCRGIDLAFHEGKPGETYNIGGRNERDNLYIVKHICALLDQKVPSANGADYSTLISFTKDRPGHDRRYAIDASKIEQELGWQAEENFETGISKTIDWYLEQWQTMAPEHLKELAS